MHREPEPCSPSSGSSHFIVRAAQPRDLSDLAGILTESFHPYTGLTRWLSPLLRMGIYEDLRNRLRSPSPNYLCLVAVDATRQYPGSGEYLAGTVEVALRSTHPWQLRSFQYPYLSNLAVRAECRRQGAAQQLLSTCERLVLDWGFEDLYLHVLENNHQARRLYAKAGYRLQQTDYNWGCWLFGQPQRLFLHKHLPPAGT